MNVKWAVCDVRVSNMRFAVQIFINTHRHIAHLMAYIQCVMAHRRKVARVSWHDVEHRLRRHVIWTVWAVCVCVCRRNMISVLYNVNFNISIMYYCVITESNMEENVKWARDDDKDNEPVWHGW